MGVGQVRHCFHNPILPLLIATGLLALFLIVLVQRPMVAQSIGASIGVSQTVGETLGICAPTTVIAATSGKTVYYCVTLRNTGTVTLTHHTLFSPSSNITATIVQTISPGAKDSFAVTSNMLSRPAVLSSSITGAAGRVITNTILVTSTDGAANVVTGTATARVVVGSVGIKVTKTVSTSAACTTTKALAVSLNSRVYYCVSVQNTGTLTLTTHHLVDPLVGVNKAGIPLALPPNRSLVITDGALSKLDSSQRLVYTVTQNVTNTTTFTSSTVEGIPISAQDRAYTFAGLPAIALTYTIGSDTTACGANKALTILSGRPIYHCLRVTNNGAVALDAYTIQWLQNGGQLLNTVITQTLPPGQSMVITSSILPQLTQLNVTANATHDFTITGRNRQGITTAPATGRTQVTIGAQTISVQKYASIDRNVCITRPLPTPPLNIVSSQAFYYCLVIANTGAIPLVRHTFSEGAPLRLSSAFTYTIQPGQRLTLTNNFFTSTLGMSPLFGPFNVTVAVPSLVFTSFSANNIPSAQMVAFQINVSTLTPTPTSPPTPVPTLTPTISPTPTPSLTSPPTPTPTPVVVSFQPTPTTLFAIDSVATPTPGVLSGGLPGQPPSPLDPALPTVDITSTLIMQTVEAAATQTALAFIPPSPTETPIPLPTDTPTLELPTVTSLPTPTSVVIATATPFILIIAPLPTPAPSGDYLALVAQIFQVSTATLGWIWFLGGSIIFFATAGIFAGLSIQQRRQQRDELFSMEEDGNLDDHTFKPGAVAPISPPAPASRPTAADQGAGSNVDDEDDYWPASLR